MTKDNLLFAIIGILLGFIAGYLSKEAMDSRQPPRLAAGQGQMGAAPGAPVGSAPGMGGAPVDPGAGGGEAPMAMIQELRERIERNPDDAEAVLQLANLNFDIRNWQRARDLYLQYLGLRPANPDVLTDLGFTHREMGQFDEALRIFRQAKQMSPDHWQSRYNEIVVLGIDLKQYEEAGRLLEELKRLQPDNPDVQQLAAAVEQSRKAA